MPFRLPLAGRLGAGGLAAGLGLVVRALKDPRRFAANAARIGTLADEFVRGGLVVETDGCSSTLQSDGDLQLRIFEGIRACPSETQARALQVHFESLAERLRPLADAAAATTLARAGLGALAGLNLVVTETARAFYGELTSVEFWLPHILTVGFAAGAAMARRLIWWLIRLWVRRRMRGADTGSPREGPAPGAAVP